MSFLGKKSVLLFLLLFILFFIHKSGHFSFLEIDMLEKLLEENPTRAGIFFALVYAIITVLFIPVGPFVVLAGAFFGTINGMIYVLIGAIIGGIISLILSRYFLRESVERFCEKRFPRFKTYTSAIEDNEKTILFLLRLTPIIPSNVLNYSCGLTRVSLITFIWTFVGVIPGTLFYTQLGTSLMDPSSKDIILLIILALLMISLTYAVRHRLPHKT